MIIRQLAAFASYLRFDVLEYVLHFACWTEFQLVAALPEQVVGAHVGLPEFRFSRNFVTAAWSTFRVARAHL